MNNGDEANIMGVDFSVRPETLAQNPDALCRGYRHGTDLPVVVYPNKNPEPTQQNHIFPLPHLPFTFDTPDGIVTRDTKATDIRFAIEVLLETQNRKTQYYFKRWVAKQEYDELITNKRLITHPRPRSRYYLVPHDIRRQVCQNCPLAISYDCEPRLFSYNSLKFLRVAVRNLLRHPDLSQKFIDLIRLLPQIFPEDAKRFESENPASISDARHNTILKQLQSEGYESVLGATPEAQDIDENKLADNFLNYLFFPAQDEENFDELWISGDQLELLTYWCSQFEALLELSELIEDENYAAFKNVMGIYIRTVHNASKHNLEIRISW